MTDDGAFGARFGHPPVSRWWSPGRVNLLGEHTDYNDGLVLPMAIDRGLRFDVAAGRSGAFRIHSNRYDETVTLEAGRLPPAPRGHWSDYFVGVLRAFPGAFDGAGLDVCVTSDLPPGRGLSSSASLTLGFAGLLNAHRGTGLGRLELARIAQAAETGFVGLACGILDPFAVAMGRADTLILLDCASMAFEAVPFPSPGFRVLVVDTGVERKLSETGYNERRAECERALALARRATPVRSLSSLPPAALVADGPLSGDPLAWRRARHVVTENERVRDGVAALRDDDPQTFGVLMSASHRSLAEDYEASCRELDVLVDLLLAMDGVAGAKMTGAGFGGAVVALVASSSVRRVQSDLPERYLAETGRRAALIVTAPADGFRRLA